jgi:Ni/Fe-hydrogenase subunit HybB-like protein
MTDILITYDVHHAAPFGSLIVLFIAVTGLSAGAYLASVVFAHLGKKEYLPLAKLSALAVILLWAAAPLLLLLDIGQPLLFWHLFVYFQPESPMAWGTLILTIYPFLGSVYIWHLFHDQIQKAKFWGLLGLPVALGSHGFVGFVLSFTSARILWTTSITPIFFLVSAALSGLALVVILDTVRYYSTLRRSPEAQARERLIFHHLGEGLYILIFADLALILFYLMKLGLTPELFDHVLKLMTEGKLSVADLFIPLVLGLMAPLVLLVVPRTARSPVSQLIASALIIFGVFFMGNLILSAAQALPLV